MINGDNSMRKKKHSKIRNTGLLYEFLLRQVTLDVLNDNNSRAVKIIKKRFNENTELGKELGLYNILTSKKSISDKKADYFINEADRFVSLHTSTLALEVLGSIPKEGLKKSQKRRCLPNCL